jgi:hypothetical protein
MIHSDTLSFIKDGGDDDDDVDVNDKRMIDIDLC